MRLGAWCVLASGALAMAGCGVDVPPPPETVQQEIARLKREAVEAARVQASLRIVVETTDPGTIEMRLQTGASSSAGNVETAPAAGAARPRWESQQQIDRRLAVSAAAARPHWSRAGCVRLTLYVDEHTVGSAQDCTNIPIVTVYWPGVH